MSAVAGRAVVLDLGNVLVRWDPYRAYEGRMPRDAVDRFFADVDFATFNHAQDAGRSWADARAVLARSHPQHVGALDLYVRHFADTLTGPVPGSAELVEDLRAAGVRLLGLTNWSAETFHHAQPAAPAIGLLEDVLVSGDVGLAKPDPAVFRLLAARYALDPARTVFVDDSPVNVDGARSVGFDGVVFTDATTLRADLTARGLLPPAAGTGPSAT
ncbi:HAD family hydrolase [Cellulomonas fimi]|uniref:HAD-superfamily hydrolase, subfamily IA, variant 3 n=1 Tax=Cellulomonas fimi (strain ATCC 484 / DSM 20113 / JCM 1341 / CCUG 24087 / LMG 16345 / NBRC 15513 / NCIMB 8980 / NCTC 7547 / NRS-133) TaxID=590998 RepID=F4GZQ5_CELFA|nr:HAD family phosphatase [Cellulomonas fimi]AEE46099.1 HAD-superfamily hydrolase, subfamily IA, variant 3 [Cellulomonas fimi ATCC 484]VEH31626.1 (S)-2-haloacid dehalogenase 4A [Cellulomonas fimi]